MRPIFPALALLLVGCATAGGNDGTPDAFPGRNDGAPEDDADLRVPDAGPNACDVQLDSLAFGFESGAQGFVSGPMPAAVATGNTTWRFDHWEQGSATLGCPDDGKCFGTNLTGNYIQCQRAYLVSPTIDLSACGTESRDVTMSFQHNYDFWTGDVAGLKYDGGSIEVSSNGTTWVPANVVFPGTIAINPNIDNGSTNYKCLDENNFYVHGKDGYVGTSGGWVNESITIPSSMASVTFQVRFVYASGVSSETFDQTESMVGTAPGWYLDNLAFQ